MPGSCELAALFIPIPDCTARTTADDDQEALGPDLQTKQPHLEQVRESKSTSDIRTWVKEVLQEPVFPFKTSNLTRLTDIRALHSADNRQRIEVLACVTSKQNSRSPFERDQEFVLHDTTDAPYTLKIRKEDYDVSHLRIGDIVYAGRELFWLAPEVVLQSVRADERKFPPPPPPPQLSRSPTKEDCSSFRTSLGSRRCRSVGA